MHFRQYSSLFSLPKTTRCKRIFFLEISKITTYGKLTNENIIFKIVSHNKEIQILNFYKMEICNCPFSFLFRLIDKYIFFGYFWSLVNDHSFLRYSLRIHPITKISTCGPLKPKCKIKNVFSYRDIIEIYFYKVQKIRKFPQRHKF